MDNKVNLVYIDENGRLIEDVDFTAVGFNGIQVEIADEAWIDLPVGADILALPGRLPLGYDEAAAEISVIEGMTAAAAILPMGFTRALTPAYEMDSYQELPLFGYTAMGAADGKLKVAALKTDAELKWNPVYYNTSDLSCRIEEKRSQLPGNRILEQLAKCALEYHCLTAQNIFYGRWEAGIPVSPVCNADCLGCISLQAAECCPSPQSRIGFVPTAAEVTDLAVQHLEQAAEGIISFGQGCEGEPSLQRELLAESIQAIRRRTGKGTININTNAGYFEAIRDLADAGLDSMRVSLFSAVSEHYQWYHRPRGYSLENVRQSLTHAAERGVMTALNLLYFPGFTNQPAETDALYELVHATGVKQVQLRNLNLDPVKLAERMADAEILPVSDWLAAFKQNFPDVLVGNYTIARQKTE